MVRHTPAFSCSATASAHKYTSRHCSFYQQTLLLLPADIAPSTSRHCSFYQQTLLFLPADIAPSTVLYCNIISRFKKKKSLAAHYTCITIVLQPHSHDFSYEACSARAVLQSKPAPRRASVFSRAMSSLHLTA